jgi:hypothetical protein
MIESSLHQAWCSWLTQNPFLLLGKCSMHRVNAQATFSHQPLLNQMSARGMQNKWALHEKESLSSSSWSFDPSFEAKTVQGVNCVLQASIAAAVLGVVLVFASSCDVCWAFYSNLVFSLPSIPWLLHFLSVAWID